MLVVLMVLLKKVKMRRHVSGFTLPFDDKIAPAKHADVRKRLD
jgi:hypothetical protein